jgi:nitrogen PTS system EIIA component
MPCGFRPHMLLSELITPDCVACNVEARSKKHCLEILSELLARTGTDVASEEIFAGLVERERLGCTCLDAGIAFPHCRVRGIETGRGAVMKLSAPVEFDAADGEMVDVVFGLLVPTVLDDEHHAVIEHITGVLRDGGLRTRLREAESDRDLYDALAADSGGQNGRKHHAAKQGGAGNG